MFVCWYGLSFGLINELHDIATLGCIIDHSIHGPLIKQAFASLDNGQRILNLISQVIHVEVQKKIDEKNHIPTHTKSHAVGHLIALTKRPANTCKNLQPTLHSLGHFFGKSLNFREFKTWKQTGTKAAPAIPLF
jgi:hypothetical protein